MCGIVGYIGDKDMASILLVGLERLSYRGYDSSGIATISNNELSYWKKAGKIHELQNTLRNMSIKGTVGIGHTRWATHGEPNEKNAHPHINKKSKIAIVHNGIIENFQTIKNQLIKDGQIFSSQTDSEVIVHLIHKYFDSSLEDAVQKTVKELDGTFAIAAIAEKDPEKMVVARKGSPIIIGVGKNANYISSDLNALVSHTKDVIYLDDNELAVLTKSAVDIKTLDGEPVEKEIHKITWDAEAADKQGYDHYMLKEIFEQPSVIRNVVSEYIDQKSVISFNGAKIDPDQLKKTSRFIIQACGTSWHAGLIAKYLIEQNARIPTEVDISSEFRYRQMIHGTNEIVIAISQSGETADTLACIREAKSKFFNILSFVNVKGSTIDRESDVVIYTHSGPEIGVASTKNFIAQVSCLYLFSIYLGLIKNHLDDAKAAEMVQQLNRLPDAIESILAQADTIKEIARKYAFSREFIFIGRGVNFPTALEGALKLKEISYIHATGYPAGELKHGPIALIDAKLPIVCVAPKCATYEKMISNIEEVKARKGKTVIIATEGDENIKQFADDIIYIPECSEDLTPILASIPLQLLAYNIAIELDCDVDQPRNLAKSVTVE